MGRLEDDCFRYFVRSLFPLVPPDDSLPRFDSRFLRQVLNSSEN